MIDAKRRNTASLFAACLAVCLFGGCCSTMKPLRYTVAVINEGREGIRVGPFELADVPEATVAVGEVLPGGRKSMSPYYCRPKQSLNLAWRFLQTSAERQARVVTELPKEFTKERGSAIVFHVRPEEGTVVVTYEILDPRTGRISVIRPSPGTSK